MPITCMIHGGGLQPGERCPVCAGLAMPMPGHIAEKARAVIEALRNVVGSGTIPDALSAMHAAAKTLDDYDQAVADDAKALLEQMAKEGMGGG